MFLRGDLEKAAAQPPAGPAAAAAASPAWGTRPAAPAATTSLKDILSQEAAAAGERSGWREVLGLWQRLLLHALAACDCVHACGAGAAAVHARSMCTPARSVMHMHRLPLPRAAVPPSASKVAPSSASKGAGTPGSARAARSASAGQESPGPAAGGLRMSLASFMVTSPLAIQRSGGSGSAKGPPPPAWGGTAGAWVAGRVCAVCVFVMHGWG